MENSVEKLFFLSLHQILDRQIVPDDAFSVYRFRYSKSGFAVTTAFMFYFKVKNQRLDLVEEFLIEKIILFLAAESW